MTNAALANQVGTAPSSCLERVRRLRRLGVISGIRAVVEPAALGRPLHAILAVQIRPHSRHLVDRFTRAALALPETLALSNVSGPEDYFLHVAAGIYNGLSSSSWQRDPRSVIATPTSSSTGPLPLRCVR